MRRPIITAICLIGCSIQLFSVIHEFLQFQVRYEVTFEYSKPFELPAVDIVINLRRVINMSKLYEQRTKEAVEMCRKVFKTPNLQIKSFEQFTRNCLRLGLEDNIVTSSILEEFLTIGDIESMTIDQRPKILSLRIFGYSEEMLNSSYCKIDHYFNVHNYFMRVSCQNGSKPLTDNISGILVNNLATMYLNHNIDQPFDLRVSHYNSGIADRISRYVTADIKERIVFLRFHRSVTERLAWPFKSECIHYDRYKQFVDCMNNESAVHNGVFRNVVIPFGGFYPPDYRFIGRINESQQMIERCSRTVENEECLEITYDTHKKAHGFRKDLNEKGVIIVEPPLNPDLFIRVYPEWTITGLLVFISSILGIWFGFSIYGKFKNCPNCWSQFCVEQSSQIEDIEEYQ